MRRRIFVLVPAIAAMLPARTAFTQDPLLPRASGEGATAPRPRPEGTPTRPGVERPSTYFAAPDEGFTPILPFSGGDRAFGTSAIKEFVQNPLQWGPFQLYPHANYTLTYATGIPRGPGETTDSVRHSMAPGVTFRSSHVVLDYTPSFNVYTKGEFADSVNHSVAFTSAYRYGDWSFTLGHNYLTGNSVLVETGRESEVTSHGTTLSAVYGFSEKTSFSFSLSQRLQETSEEGSGSATWSSMNWMNRRLTQKITAGIGIGGGFTKMDRGGEMTYEQLQASLGWTPGPKLSVGVNGGFDVRQFGGGEDQINPIFGASGSYQLFETTGISLRANRVISPSLLSGLITESTTVSVGLNQRLLGHVQLGLSVGYRMADYQSVSDGVPIDRSDEGTTFTASLRTRVLQRGSIGVSYTRTSNTSNARAFDIETDQYSLSLGYRF